MKIVIPNAVTDSVLLDSNIAEDDYPLYSVTTTYALGARVIVVGSNVHRIYESLQNTNLNHDPATSTTWWIDVSATNRWKMFDDSVTTQTTNADQISVSLLIPGRVNMAAALNVSCQSIRVAMTDGANGIVYDKTISAKSFAGITDWYKYFFAPVYRRKDIVFEDMPEYAGTRIDVQVNGTGETVACGALICGQGMGIGRTELGASVGIQDYSVKKRDDFGNYRILERAYNKAGRFTTWVESANVDEVYSILSQYRARPALYVADSSYGSTYIYGFFKDFAMTIQYAKLSVCTLEIEGLI